MLNLLSKANYQTFKQKHYILYINAHNWHNGGFLTGLHVLGRILLARSHACIFQCRKVPTEEHTCICPIQLNPREPFCCVLNTKTLFVMQDEEEAVQCSTAPAVRPTYLPRLGAMGLNAFLGECGETGNNCTAINYSVVLLKPTHPACMMFSWGGSPPGPCQLKRLSFPSGCHSPRAAKSRVSDF